MQPFPMSMSMPPMSPIQLSYGIPYPYAMYPRQRSVAPYNRGQMGYVGYGYDQTT